jgi:hypothetical protein
MIKACTTLVPGCVVTVPVDVLDVVFPLPKDVLLEAPIIPPFAEPDLFLGIVSSYSDTQAVPFQSYLVGVSDVSSDLIASQPLVLSALYFVSFQLIKYTTSPSSVIVG